MSKTIKYSGRKLKKKILELLTQKNFERSLEEIRPFPARQVINPLFSFLYNSDEMIKWRAVTAMGMVVSRLAEQDTESARVIMRRLLWNLNDESGGIGWGSPEAMGEIMAQSKKLAEEYHCILISYIREDGNFIEHEILQRGVLWGLGRLARVRPELVKDAAPFLAPYMNSEDAVHRGLAARTAALLDAESLKPLLRYLANDHTKIKIFLEGELVSRSVAELTGQMISEKS
ncbi:DVU0298 family protein [Desulfonema magnum]|uniref:HEAT repeat domain-containing protein n=1 Tax=Desulfonema magnum TaxID=45655 RepID=A0A975BTI1_9BACT|nr:DVU0298 family protein [Desulfonema magnum]QTA91158.1 HEAT repeat domain-containing protein [Desulfonema magnum]